MDHREIGALWNGNADAWSDLSRAGYNVSRDLILNPAFFAMLPEVPGLRGLDIGCGNGDNTRLVAERGARMTGLDIAPRFIEIARATEAADPRGIAYHCASAVELPFDDDAFDFAVAFMSLMDVPEFDRALAEAHRVIRPGGFLQFSITHPCCDVPLRRKIRDEEGTPIAFTLGGYFAGSTFQVNEWLFGAAPAEVKVHYPKFRQAFLHHTLSEWLNALIRLRFTLEEVVEPAIAPALLDRYPDEIDSWVWPYFMIFRCRK